MKRIVFIILFCFFSNAWAAAGIDIAQSMKQYAVLMKQLKQLKKQVAQADTMIDQGKQAVKDMEGHYGYGKLLDSQTDFQKRNWAPKTWDDALKALSGGNSARYQELLKAYHVNYPTLSDKQFSNGASQSLLKRYKNLVQENRASTAIANKEYEDIDNHLKTIHALTQKIESASNTKAAMDLNSRLVAELSYISVEQLRMQTLINHQVAAEAFDDISARSREAIFNQLPKEK